MTVMRQSQRHYSLDEYFLAEQMSPLKHEYFAGQIFTISGGSNNHVLIGVNVITLLRTALRGSGCKVYSGDMRIRTPSGLYTYPDASVVCGSPDLARIQGTDTIGNPVVLVEVLSESTGEYDRGEKFELYRSIPTFRDYVLIEQTHVGIEHRYHANGEWSSRTFSALDERVGLTGLSLDVPLSMVYDDVTF
jgi:Uma2 family endonuclease